MKLKSISIKIFSLFLSFILLILGISWVIQTQFLEKYYVHKKLETMEQYGQDIMDRWNKMNQDEIGSYVQEIAEKNGGRIIIINKDDEILFYSGQRGNMGWVDIMEVWSELQTQGEISYRTKSHKGFMEWIIYGKINKEGVGVIIQNPIQSIKDTVNITQRFYIYIFGMAILFSILLGWIFSRQVTKPLVKLNNLVKQMEKLNFNIRYEENREDEIGQLGRSFNFLTTKLDKTIKELKLELQKEKNLDKMRKQFVARVSHELQTPISIIQGYAEGLKDGIVTTKKDKDFYCDVIYDETKKLSRIVKDLLDLSQLESGTFKVQMKKFNVNDFLEEVISKYQLIMNDELIKFEWAGLEDEVWVLGDEHRIEQVMVNFLQNAIYHTKKEGKIKVILQKKEDQLRIAIQNTGEKIREDEISLIWNSFYKGEDKEEKKGTGLGLAIAKSILKLHDSQFGARNIEDGVEFFFTLKVNKIND